MERLPYTPFMERLRFIGYGLIAGLVIGAVLGWWLHAWIGFIFKLVLLAIFLTPLVVAIYFWRRVTAGPSAPRDGRVRDADWVEIESTTRPRR